MPSATFHLQSAADGLSLFAYDWRPDSRPRAVVQIAHGMGEHAGRYAGLAEALVARGYAVRAHDQRGHGRSARPDELGFFAETDGWNKLVADLWQVSRRIAADYPGVPIVLLGHSMGSFAAQQFLFQHGEVLAAAILSGSNGRPATFSLAAGLLVARVERFRIGRRGQSLLLDFLSFGSFNRAFRPARTWFDWLSRNPAEVDRYLADPLCGFSLRVQSWIDLLRGLDWIGRPANQAAIPRDLPIRIMAGSCDPVSNRTRGLQKLLAAYGAAGLRRVSHQFYAGARHELFHETNRDAVTADLIAWLDDAVRLEPADRRP